VSHHLAPPTSRHQLRPAPKRAAGRGVIAFLGLVFAASIAVAVVLPRSSSAPFISAFIPIGVLILITPFEGRSVWEQLGVARAGIRLWPIAVAVPVAVAATSYLIAWRLALVKPVAVLISVADLAGEGGVVTALAMTAVAIVVLNYARRTVWLSATSMTHRKVSQ
jgi:hypothetical protein